LNRYDKVKIYSGILGINSFEAVLWGTYYKQNRNEERHLIKWTVQLEDRVYRNAVKAFLGSKDEKAVKQAN